MKGGKIGDFEKLVMLEIFEKLATVGVETVEAEVVTGYIALAFEV